MNTEKKIRIQALLDGETAQKYHEIKQDLGLTRDAEVIRLVISDFYRKRFKEK